MLNYRIDYKTLNKLQHTGEMFKRRVHRWGMYRQVYGIYFGLSSRRRHCVINTRGLALRDEPQV